MISLIVEFAVFLLVMFFLVPAFMIFVMMRRVPLHADRKHSSAAG